MLRSNADARRCSYFELGLPVLYSSQNGRGVGRETQRQMKLRGRFPVARLPLVNSGLRFARKFIALSKLSRSQSCAEKKREKGTCLIKCPCTRSWIVLKTESSFSPFKAFRHQKCRFSKNGPQSGVFCCKRWLIRDLTEFTQQDDKILVCDKRGRAIT